MLPQPKLVTAARVFLVALVTGLGGLVLAALHPLTSESAFPLVVLGSIGCAVAAMAVYWLVQSWLQRRRARQRELLRRVEALEIAVAHLLRR